MTFLTRILAVLASIMVLTAASCPPTPQDCKKGFLEDSDTPIADGEFRVEISDGGEVLGTGLVRGMGEPFPIELKGNLNVSQDIQITSIRGDGIISTSGRDLSGDWIMTIDGTQISGSSHDEGQCSIAREQRYVVVADLDEGPDGWMNCTVLRTSEAHTKRQVFGPATLERSYDWARESCQNYPN